MRDKRKSLEVCQKELDLCRVNGLLDFWYFGSSGILFAGAMLSGAVEKGSDALGTQDGSITLSRM